MAKISRKKEVYAISDELRGYLDQYGREMHLPIRYSDLLRYEDKIPVLDKYERDTLWVSLIYSESETNHIHAALKRIYSVLQAGGVEGVQDHLYVERVDLCLYGNTNPFRVRIVNRINDNFDYFYIKHADASRIFGLELEDLLSPNNISYVVSDETLVEEHIAGIPGEEFMRKYLGKGKKGRRVRKVENETRLAKEFVKFNERCFVRLLGDMHSSNYVVVITPDFDDVHYRIRAIDFDQQSYESRASIYQPKYFKQNDLIIELGMRHMDPVTMLQYQTEERAMIASRIRYSKEQIKAILSAMRHSNIAPFAHVSRLREELARHYSNNTFLHCQNMGEIVELSLELVLEAHQPETVRW